MRSGTFRKGIPKAAARSGRWRGWLLLLFAAAWAPQTLAEEIGQQSFTSFRSLGSAQLVGGIGTDRGTDTLADVTRFRRADLDALADIEGIAGETPLATPLVVPSVRNTPVSLVNKGFSGFDGVNHADQRFAGTGAFTNTQFSKEPPDQGLCVGNGFVVEPVNTAISVYSFDGTLLSGPVPLNQFFGLAPEIDRTTVRFGDFTSDPRCYYDAPTNRFFVLLLQLDVDPATGAFTGPTHQLLAVSQTGNPTGSWNRFVLDTTGDGANCPCFGDQPLLGADANGIYISGNAFSLVDGRFKGAQIYAASKLFLAAGQVPPFVLHINLPRDAADGGLNRSVHPATRVRGEEFSRFGTEYFLSTFNLAALENQLVVWSLRGTQQLHFPPGPGTHFVFQRLAILSETYGIPPDALQKIGPLPLGSVVNPGVRESLATNAQNMQQVTFADGRLWGTVSTVLRSREDTVPAGAFGDPNKAGVAWFSVKVSGSPTLDARVHRQGYVAIKNANLLFPVLGINRHGNAAIGFSISGPDLFPSTGYVVSRGDDGFGRIHVAGAGVASEDGFTGYPSQNPPGTTPCDSQENPTECEARWGDYGASAIGGDGSIWLGGEYIGPRPRSVAANWGTFITRLQVDEDQDDDHDHGPGRGHGDD
ncbi:MAG TPA: hypothetical protein VFN45_18595 [Myxococcaceae bacterium]|nr:hypothetical protein [Myxococcaceae bacterium]